MPNLRLLLVFISLFNFGCACFALPNPPGVMPWKGRAIKPEDYVSHLPVLPKRVLCDVKQVIVTDVSTDSVDVGRPVYLYSPKMPFQYNFPYEKRSVERATENALKSTFDGSVNLHFEINSSNGRIHFTKSSQKDPKLREASKEKTTRPAFDLQEGDERPVILSGKAAINTDGPYYVGYYSYAIPNYTAFLFLDTPSEQGVRVFEYYDKSFIYFGYCH